MMMKWTDDTLMAFADGELDMAQRADIERALAADAALRQRVTALTMQRERVAAAFAPVLDEPVPDRLAGLLRPSSAPPAATPVVNLGERRAARERSARLPSWAQWGGLAASVLMGVLLGMQFKPSGADPAIELRDGQLLAGGTVEQALASQLASQPAVGALVAVQLSFVDKGGSYCRTFSTAALAGLACKQGERWTVQSLATAASTPASAVRQAASALPPAVLSAVDQRIAGDALDPVRERQARDRGWRR
jgi:hypothetical protein